MSATAAAPAITGVHPYADKFPMLPEVDHTLYGTCPERDLLVSVRESGKHPGYYDVNIYANGQAASLKRPVQGDDIGRDLIHSYIQSESPGVSLTWSTQYIPRPEPQSALEYIYFITDEDGYIKIGYALSPDARLKALQTASRQELRIIGVTPGSITDEKALHARFADAHVRGEWFKPSRELCEYIQEVSK